MKILVIGSGIQDRANILDALAEIEPEFTVGFINEKEIKSMRSQMPLALAHVMHDEAYDSINEKQTKYTCKGVAKRR